MIDVSRFDVCLVNLDPTIGREIKKTRPCVVVSPDEIRWLKTVIIAPLTSNGFAAPTRIKLIFKKKEGFILLDQIRTIGKKRIIKKLGVINRATQIKVSKVLVEMFQY